MQKLQINARTAKGVLPNGSSQRRKKKMMATSKKKTAILSVASPSTKQW